MAAALTTGDTDQPFLPFEVVVKILNQATPSTLTVAKRVCKDWGLEVQRIFSTYTKDDWNQACLKEIPRPVLYQLITALGLSRPGDEECDHKLEAVIWRMLFPAAFLRTVPMFESMVEYQKAERPREIPFDGEKAYKAWFSARLVRTRKPVISSFRVPAVAAVSCMKVS